MKVAMFADWLKATAGILLLLAGDNPPQDATALPPGRPA